MCQHALCEHNSSSSSTTTLLPQPPSYVNTVYNIIIILLPLSFLLWICSFQGQSYIPLKWTFSLFLCLLVTIAYNVVTYKSSQLTPAEKKGLESEDHASWVARSSKLETQKKLCTNLSELIQIPSVSIDVQDTVGQSSEEMKKNNACFLEIHKLLEQSYPLVHKSLEKVVINDYSLLYKWKGSASSTSSTSTPPLKPYLLCAHLDVVPVLDQHLWEKPAFSGEITKDGFIYGRGAIDDKQAVSGILCAIEDLLSTGYSPQRDVYLAFGHDEEIGGMNGAAFIAKYLKEKGVRVEFMLDEGLFVMSGILPGLKDQIALVCIAEKGYLVNELKSSVPASLAGHASTPGTESAIGILSKALIKMEQNPMPSYLLKGTPVRMMFEYLAPHFNGIFKVLFTNLWLFAPVLKFALTRKNTTATMVRTTTALTVFKSGSKENVVPREASAWINHRIHPIDSVKGVIEYTRNIISDQRVTVTELRSIPPAPVSSATSRGFMTIQQALGRALPDVLVAPAMMVGNTDTHHYWDIADDIYRFSPTRLTNESVAMFHGANEKIRVDNFIETIGFYRAVIQLADRPNEK